MTPGELGAAVESASASVKTYRSNTQPSAADFLRMAHGYEAPALRDEGEEEEKGVEGEEEGGESDDEFF